MKKILLQLSQPLNFKHVLLLSAFLIVNAINAQTYKGKVKVKSCVTSSCCDFMIFNVSVFEETVCHYIWVDGGGRKQNVISIKLSTRNNESISQIILNEDIILADMFDEDGSGLMLPKGSYNLLNNELEFIAQKVGIKKICYTRISNLTLFGVEMGSVITICAYIPFIERTNQHGNIKISANFSSAELEKIRQNNFYISIADDIVINQVVDGRTIYSLVKAGTYKCQEDGSIILQHVSI